MKFDFYDDHMEIRIPNHFDYIHGSVLCDNVAISFDDVRYKQIYKSIKEKMDKNVVENEPHIALFTPNDSPLLFYNAILEYAKKHLAKNGFIFFELHENYVNETLAWALRFFNKAELKQDFQGKNRFLIIENQ